MSRVLTKVECLELDIEIYNIAMELQWSQDKIYKNLSGDLRICKHCGRKYSICCICPESEANWGEMIDEVKAVSERSSEVTKEEKKLILRNTECNKIPIWGGDPQLVEDEVVLCFGDEVYQHTVREGEPEDMIFGRDLEDCGSIINMIQLAHRCGKDGIELEVILQQD